MLICGITDAIIRDCIGLAQHNGEGVAIGTLVYFLVLCLSIIILPLGFICIKEMQCSRGDIIPFVLQLVVAALYFFGDNFGYVLPHYADALNCSDTCQRGVEVARHAALGTAIIIIHSIPVLDWDATYDNNYKKKYKSLHYTLNVIAVLIKIDMIYSIVTAVVQSDADCSTTNKALTYSFFAIATVIGWISIIFQSVEGKHALYKDVDICDCTTVFGIILLLVSLPMFLLSDNRQPLDCEFGCVVISNNTISNNTAGNMTSADACNYIANHSVSLAFIVVVAFSVLYVLGVVRSKLPKSQEPSYPISIPI